MPETETSNRTSPEVTSTAAVGRTAEVSTPTGQDDRRSSSWDIKNAPANYASLGVLHILSAALSFGAVWLITKQISTEGYGGVVAVIAASQIVQMFVNWTTVSLSRYGVEEYVKRGNINRAFWARTSILVPNIVVAFCFSFLWLPAISSWLKIPSDLAWLVVFHIIATTIWLHIQHALQGAKLPRTQSLLLTFERVVVFIALLVLVYRQTLDVRSALIIYAAGQIFVSVVGIWLLRKYISVKPEFDRETFAKMWRFSYPLIPFTLIGYFSSSYVDAIFIAQYLEKSDLGIYGVAYQISGALLQFLVLANTLLTPMFITMRTNGEESKMKKYVETIVPTITLFAGLAIVMIAATVSFALPFFFDSSAAQISTVFTILSLATLAAVPTLMGFVPYFISHSSTYIGTINAVVVASVNVVANFILIPRYGLIGSAWATAISTLIGSVIMILIVSKKFDLRILWTTLGAAPAVTSIAIGIFLDSYFVLLIVCIGLSFGLVMFRFKAIRTSLDWIRS